MANCCAPRTRAGGVHIRAAVAGRKERAKCVSTEVRECVSASVRDSPGCGRAAARDAAHRQAAESAQASRRRTFAPLLRRSGEFIIRFRRRTARYPSTTRGIIRSSRTSHVRTSTLTHSRTHALTHSRTHALPAIFPPRDPEITREEPSLVRAAGLHLRRRIVPGQPVQGPRTARGRRRRGGVLACRRKAGSAATSGRASRTPPTTAWPSAAPSSPWRRSSSPVARRLYLRQPLPGGRDDAVGARLGRARLEAQGRRDREPGDVARARPRRRAAPGALAVGQGPRRPSAERVRQPPRHPRRRQADRQRRPDPVQVRRVDRRGAGEGALPRTSSPMPPDNFEFKAARKLPTR